MPVNRQLIIAEPRFLVRKFFNVKVLTNYFQCEEECIYKQITDKFQCTTPWINIASITYPECNSYELVRYIMLYYTDSYVHFYIFRNLLCSWTGFRTTKSHIRFNSITRTLTSVNACIFGNGCILFAGIANDTWNPANA